MPPAPAVVQTLSALGRKLKLPDIVIVFPEATVQVEPAPDELAFAKTVTGLAIVMLTPLKLSAVEAAVVIPNVNVPAPEISMSPVAPVTEMAAQLAEEPNVSPGPSDVADQVAVSAEFGEPFAPDPPDQTPAVPPVRSVPVACFVAVAAKPDDAHAIIKPT